MSPVGSLAGAYRVAKVAQQLPLDNSTIVGAGILQWASEAANDKEGVPVHFRVQLSLVSNFASLVAEYVSWVDASLFDYESSPGVWTALPSSGLALVNLGKNVRVRTTYSTLSTVFWRIRTEQLV